MKFTLIYDPKKPCSLQTKLNDTETCSGGTYIIKPELSSNLSGIVEGCKVHLLKAKTKPEVFVLEQKQYGKPQPKRDENGNIMTVKHTYHDGREVIYKAPHPKAGENVMKTLYEPKPLHSIISVDKTEFIAYLVSLEEIL